MFSGIKTYAIIGLAAALALLGWLYKAERDTVAELTAKYSAEQTAHAVTKAGFEDYIKSTEKTLKTTQESVTRISKDYARERATAGELSKKLEAHSFPHLAFKKPGLVTGIVNRGTQEVLNGIENNTK